MRKILTAIIVLFFTAGFAYSQQQQQQPVILQPVVEIGDVLFVINALGTIDITGQEVDAFLECKNAMQEVIKKSTELNKKTTDSVQFGINALVAQNLLNFLQRAKISGSMAGRYKGFYNSIMESAKPFMKANAQPAATDPKKKQ